MGPSIGPIVLLFSTFVSVEPHMQNPATPDVPPPIEHVQLPDHVNQLRVSANSQVWVFAAHEEHRDVVVRNTLDRTMNGEWGKFVACQMQAWGTCDVTVGPFEADITDVYLVYWGPGVFTDDDPGAYSEAHVNLVATRIEDPIMRPVVNVDVQIDLFDWFLRRLFGR